MYTLKNLIICVFLTQFAVGCSASLPEQCKQLKAINQEAYTEKKDPVPSRQFEILSEQFSKKSKDIENLSISDKDLKGIQQRFATNYDTFRDKKIFFCNNNINQVTSYMALYIAVGYRRITILCTNC